MEHISQIIGANAHEVLPGVWLGNKVSSENVEFLQEANIVAIFNCTKTIPFTIGPWRLYRIPVDDNLRDEEIRNLSLWSFEIAYKIMNERKNGPILIHCHAGMQRSAASLAIYMISVYRCTAQEAIDYIQKKRPIAFRPSANFRRAIEEFEHTLRTMIRESANPLMYSRRPFPTSVPM